MEGRLLSDSFNQTVEPEPGLGAEAAEEGPRPAEKKRGGGAQVGNGLSAGKREGGRTATGKGWDRKGGAERK